MVAVYVLWLRQLKRYIRSRERIIGTIAQSIFVLVGLGFGFGPIYAKAGEGNFIQFLTPGAITLSIMLTAMFSGVEVIFDRQFGFLKETLVAPASRLGIVLGRTLGGTTVAFFQGLIILIFANFIGFHITEPRMLPFAFLFMILLGVLFTALGTGVAALLTDVQGFQLLINVIVLPLYFISGALFPLEDLPRFLTIATAFNPLSYGIDGLRATLTGQSIFGFTNDLIVISLTTILFLAITTYLFERIEP